MARDAFAGENGSMSTNSSRVAVAPVRERLEIIKKAAGALEIFGGGMSVVLPENAATLLIGNALDSAKADVEGRMVADSGGGPSAPIGITNPRLFMDFYLPLFDQEYARITGTRIDPAWTSELKSRVHEFQAAWDAVGPALLQTLYKETDKRFSRSELTVSFTVGMQTSLSNPLLVYIRPWLRSANPGGVAPTIGLINVLFHETIHNLLREWLSPTTPLLRKYQGEPKLVQSHLHLIALQQHVYTVLNRKDLYDENRRMLINRPAGDPYRRAIEIVESEGIKAFVDEVRTAMPPLIRAEVVGNDMDDFAIDASR